MTIGTPGSQLITIERAAQLAKGYTIAGDKANNTEYQLVDAAGVLMTNYPEEIDPVAIHGQFPPIGWNKEIWHKMLRKPYKERLIISGALVAAEIDRIS